MTDFLYDPYDESTCLFGMGGSGKSFFFRNFIVKQCWQSLPAWWAFDPMRQHSELSSQGALITGDLKQLSYRKIVFQPQTSNPEVFDKFCLAAMGNTNLPVAFEELQKYLSKHTMPRPFADLELTGRNRGITYTAITRTPWLIHNEIISDAQHRFCFKLDLSVGGLKDFLREYFGASILDPRLQTEKHVYAYRFHEADDCVIMNPI